MPLRKTIDCEPPPLLTETAAAASAPAPPAPLARNPDAVLPMRSPRRRPPRLRRGERSWNLGDTPFCPRCGKKMEIRRHNSGEEFWACPSFPRCLGSRRK